jgi:hypothetical protein
MPGAGRVDTRRSVAGRVTFAAASALLFSALVLWPTSGFADSAIPWHLFSLEAVLRRLRSLNRHELAMLALTFGVIAFAVTTSISLVQTRRRLSKSFYASRQYIFRLRD